jgi:hypothetical protein
MVSDAIRMFLKQVHGEVHQEPSDTVAREKELKEQLKNKIKSTKSGESSKFNETLNVLTSVVHSESKTNQPPAAGGLFGQQSQTTQPATTTTTTSSLFGSSLATTKPGGLFGNTATTSSQPQQSGGLFGTAASTNTNQPQQQPTSSLFGSVNTTNAPAQQTAGSSLFGGGATNTATPQQTGGLFGSSTQPAQPAQNGGQIGAQVQAPNQSHNTGIMFGSSLLSKPQQPTTAGSSLFGQPAQQKSTLLYEPLSVLTLWFDSNSLVGKRRAKAVRLAQACQPWANPSTSRQFPAFG